MGEARTVLVTGATGTQGGAVARALLAAGHRVRALTRTPASARSDALRRLGAHVVAGDFDYPGSVLEAATGVDVVFAVGTPYEAGVAAEIRQSRAIVDAACEARVSHLVYTSIAGADRPCGVPHTEAKGQIEQYVRASQLPFTIVGPVAFLEAIAAPWSGPVLAAGIVSQPSPPDRRVQWVAAADVGSFVAQIVDRPREFAGRRVDVASIEMSGAEIVESLGVHLGRAMTYSRQRDAEVRATGRADVTWISDVSDRTGFSVDIPALHAAYPEIGWHTFDGWASGVDWPTVLAPTRPRW